MQKTILSTADVARLFNITETTVKRWADDGTLKCHKTLGGHRKFDVKSVIEFATSNGMEPVGTLALEQDSFSAAIQVAVLGQDFGTLSAIFVEKAMSVDRHDLSKFLSYLYQHRLQLWQIYDLVIRPGLYEICGRRRKKEIDVYLEHRAYHETLDSMARLQTEIFNKPPAGKKTVCACLDDDSHDISLRCAANIFESEGWTVHYLGNGIPYNSVVQSVKDVRPHVVCLSVTDFEMTSGQLGKLRELRRHVHRGEGRLILGGEIVPGKQMDSGFCDTIFHSMEGLTKYIHELHVSVVKRSHRRESARTQ